MSSFPLTPKLALSFNKSNAEASFKNSSDEINQAPEAEPSAAIANHQC